MEAEDDGMAESGLVQSQSRDTFSPSVPSILVPTLMYSILSLGTYDQQMMPCVLSLVYSPVTPATLPRQMDICDRQRRPKKEPHAPRCRAIKQPYLRLGTNRRGLGQRLHVEWPNGIHSSLWYNTQVPSSQPKNQQRKEKTKQIQHD